MVLLFDQTKALEKALGTEAAATLIKVLESQEADVRKDLATKADLESGLRELEHRLKAEITIPIIKWVAAMLVAQAAAIAALVKLL